MGVFFFVEYTCMNSSCFRQYQTYNDSRWNNIFKYTNINCVVLIYVLKVATNICPFCLKILKKYFCLKVYMYVYENHTNILQHHTPLNHKLVKNSDITDINKQAIKYQ